MGYNNRDCVNLHKVKIKDKCAICKKLLRNNHYTVSNKGYKKPICSNCKYIYDTFYKIYNTDKECRILGQIFAFVFSRRNTKDKFTVKKLQKTHRSGIFIKPSNAVNPYGVIKDRLCYNKMKKKCCRFCGKQFIKHYVSIQKNDEEEIRICRDCEPIFRIMLEEDRRGKERTIRDIYEFIRFNILYTKEYI